MTEREAAHDYIGLTSVFPTDSNETLATLRSWASSLGFSHLGVSDTDLSRAEPYLLAWLANGYHGEMGYMQKHGTKRSRPKELVPNTLRIITVRFPYLQSSIQNSQRILAQPETAYVARYALGEDYHTVVKERLHQLAQRLQEAIGDHGYRAFVDSAPVLEVELAQKAGLGWRGKHTLLLSRDEGSFFFLGEIFTTLPLPTTPPTSAHCGSCTRCITACPTQAITAPYQLDARRCIAYLTIELHGTIPVEFRAQIGNRIYGCDDCQLVCPWNKYAKQSQEIRFQIRAKLDASSLLDLWRWSEETFLHHTQDSAIQRIGYKRWRRNLAIGLGNAPFSKAILEALIHAYHDATDLVREHISWAIEEQLEKQLR
jgi:epoxyqueuosine reductase